MYHRKGCWGNTILFLPILIIGLFLYQALENAYKWQLLLRNGIQTEGTVTNIHYEYRQRPRVTYEFQVQTSSGTSTIERREVKMVWVSAKVGEPITVIYLPADPTITGMKGNYEFLEMPLWLILLIPFALYKPLSRYFEGKRSQRSYQRMLKDSSRYW